MAETDRITFPADDGLEKGILAYCADYGSIHVKTILESDFHYAENKKVFTFILSCVDKFELSYGLCCAEASSRKCDFDIPKAADHHLLGNVEWYIDKLKELARRRVLIQNSQKLIERMVDTDCDVSISESEMRYILDNKDQKGGLVNISKIVPEAMAEFERMARGEKCGLSYGIQPIDEITGGIEWGDYIILAGRPSTGKTTLAMNIGVNIAQSGVPVYLFEIEMTSVKIVERLVCSIAGVNLFSLKYKRLNQGDDEKVMKMCDTVKTLPFYIESSAFATPAKIRQKTHSIVSKHGRGLVIIDYIQLMRPDRDLKNKVNEVSEISASIKGICTELQMPCIALSQFSRESEKRTGPPIMSDLRDCGSLEQDADTIIALTKSESTTPDTVVIVDSYVLKNRNGPTGKIKLKYTKAQFRFEDCPQL